MIEGRVDFSGLAGLAGGMRAGLLGGGAPGGLLGGVGKALGGLGLISGTLGEISKGVQKVVEVLQESSGMLRSSMKMVERSFLSIIKPIGDILGVGLMPIFYTLRPIGLFFNTLMRPYLQQAMKAMRAGGQYMMAGDSLKAGLAFNLGFQFLSKPLNDAIGAALLEPTRLLLTGFKGLGDAFLDVTGIIFPFSGLVKNVFDKGMSDMIGGYTTFENAVTGGFSKMYDNALASITTDADAVTVAMRSPLKKTNDYVKNEWGPAFQSAIRSAMSKASEDAKVGRFMSLSNDPNWWKALTGMSQNELSSRGLMP